MNTNGNLGAVPGGAGMPELDKVRAVVTRANAVLYLLSKDLFNGYKLAGDWINEQERPWEILSLAVAPAFLPSPIVGQQIGAFVITVVLQIPRRRRPLRREVGTASDTDTE